MSIENEVWKPTFVNPYYLVSNLGRIKSVDHPIWCKQNNSYSMRKGKLLKPNNKNTKKYWRIHIPFIGGTRANKKTYSVHRLVATAFVPNPNNLPQINHIDGNKDNNSANNLEWCDNGYNQRHAIKNGLKDKSKMSAHCHLRKLTEEQVSYIKKEYSKAVFTKRGDKMRFCKKMRDKFNLKSANTIFWIIQGGTNKYININQINESIV